MVVAGLTGGDGAAVAHLGAVKGHTLGKVPYGPLVLIVEGVFLLGKYLATGGGISALQVKVEYLSKLAVGLSAAPSAVGICVKEDSVTLVGEHEGDAYLGIVLVQLLTAALVVKFPGLMLSKSVEGFVVSGGKTHGRATVKAHAAIIGKDIAFPVIEAHASIGLVNIHGKGLCGKMHYAHGL